MKAITIIIITVVVGILLVVDGCTVVFFSFAVDSADVVVVDFVNYAVVVVVIKRTHMMFFTLITKVFKFKFCFEGKVIGVELFPKDLIGVIKFYTFFPWVFRT